jgi:hypothetical protein
MRVAGAFEHAGYFGAQFFGLQDAQCIKRRYRRSLQPFKLLPA